VPGKGGMVQALNGTAAVAVDLRVTSSGRSGIAGRHQGNQLEHGNGSLECVSNDSKHNESGCKASMNGQEGRKEFPVQGPLKKRPGSALRIPASKYALRAFQA
jgi:hypothetical protein